MMTSLMLNGICNGCEISTRFLGGGEIIGKVHRRSRIIFGEISWEVFTGLREEKESPSIAARAVSCLTPYADQRL